MKVWIVWQDGTDCEIGKILGVYLNEHRLNDALNFRFPADVRVTCWDVTDDRELV